MIKSRKLRWVGHVARMGISRSTPTGERPLGRPRRRWENTITMDVN